MRDFASIVGDERQGLVGTISAMADDALRVLIVEDNEGWHKALETIVKSYGYRPVGAYNCWQAQDLIESEPFDLAIVDVHLPDKRGVELVAMVREHNADVRILVSTGFPDYRTATEALRAGADDFCLSKRESIERFLEGKPASEPTDNDCYPTLDQAKRDHAFRVLDAHAGNISQAAKVLGITRSTLHRLLRREAAS